VNRKDVSSSAVFLLCSIALLACFSLFFSDWRAFTAFSTFLVICAFFFEVKKRLELSSNKSKAHAGLLVPKAYHTTSIIAAGVFLFALNVPPAAAGFTLENFSQSLFFSVSFSVLLVAAYIALYFFLNKCLPNFSMQGSLSLKKILWELPRVASEEAWFRGVILFLLLSSTTLLWAIVLSSALFASAHFKGNWISRAWALAMAVGFGTITAFTGSLAGPIIGHAVFNLAVSTLKKANPKFTQL